MVPRAPGLFVTLAAALFAQDSLTLKVETRAVQINVAVKDSQGHPVRGLRQEDFVVTDNGRRREINLFSAEDETGPAAVPAVLPPNIFSNRFPGTPGRVTAILLDALSTPFEHQSYARAQAIKAVENMTPTESIAIYVLRQNLEVLQNYTTSRDRLLDALHRFLPRQPRMPDGSGQFGYRAERQTVDNTSPAAAMRRPAGIAQILLRERIETTLEALRAISKHMAAAGGRKSILWITAGFPPDRDYREQIDTAINAINESNVAIYPVDARGLLPSPNAIINIQLMQELAQSTGGQAYYNRNDLDHAIEEAVADARYTYALAFYLPEKDLDGEYHKLTVKVDRPGLVLHYRRGYQAVVEAKTPVRKKDNLTAELLNPLDRSEIGIDARLEVQRDKNGQQLRIVLSLDPGTVTQTQPDGSSAMKLAQLLIEADAQGRVLERIATNFMVPVPPGKPKGAFSQTMRLHQNAETLHIVMRDLISGHTGSLTAQLVSVIPH